MLPSWPRGLSGPPCISPQRPPACLAVAARSGCSCPTRPGQGGTPYALSTRLTAGSAGAAGAGVSLWGAGRYNGTASSGTTTVQKLYGSSSTVAPLPRLRYGSSSTIHGGTRVPSPQRYSGSSSGTATAAMASEAAASTLIIKNHKKEDPSLPCPPLPLPLHLLSPFPCPFLP